MDQGGGIERAPGADHGAPRHDDSWTPVGTAVTDGTPPVAPAAGPPGPPAWSASEPEPAGPPEARKPTGNTGWDIMLGVNLGLVGISVLFSIGAYFVFLASGDDPAAAIEGMDPAVAKLTLYIGSFINLIMFGLVPFLWVLGTRIGGLEGALRFLQMRDFLRNTLLGIPAAILLAGAALLLAVGLSLIGFDIESTPNTEAITSAIDWPLVFFISFVAGVSEEILFRGVLQKWLGWVGQGFLFGLFHLANGPTALVVTSAIGLLFGYLVKRGMSMWFVISVHLFYDVVLLSLTLLFPELAGG